jgi:hypothetical protein
MVTELASTIVYLILMLLKDSFEKILEIVEF